jgi:hypothetical protein
LNSTYQASKDSYIFDAINHREVQVVERTVDHSDDEVEWIKIELESKV